MRKEPFAPFWARDRVNWTTTTLKYISLKGFHYIYIYILRTKAPSWGEGALCILRVREIYLTVVEVYICVYSFVTG